MRSSRSALVMAWLAAAAAGGPVAGSAPAVEPTEAEQKADWAGLDALIIAGEYAKAATAADAIVERVRPTRRGADFVDRTIGLIQALARRGLAELRLGKLDAAKQTVEEAHRALLDKDFQRLFGLQVRQTPPAKAGTFIPLELEWIDLVNLRSAVVLEQMRYAVLDGEGDAAAVEPTAEFLRQIDAWLAELRTLERGAAEAREAVAGRLDKGGLAVLNSPYFQALAGAFRPEMTAGMTALELARLPPRKAAGGEGGKAAAAPRSREQLLADARGHFERAAKALDAAVAAAKQAAGPLRPEQQIEAALLESEWLVARGSATMEAGDPDAARKDFAKALDLLREVAVLRKRADPATHPDRFWPLLLAAEAALEQSRRMLADGDSDGAQTRAMQASNLLAEATGLPVPDEQPLRRHLAALQSRLEAQTAALAASIPRQDAADAAARGQRRAIDATAVEGVAF